MIKYYVCLKHGTAWMDEIQNMHSDYQYGNHIHYFASYEEAEDYLSFLQASLDAEEDKLCGYETGE